MKSKKLQSLSLSVICALFVMCMLAVPSWAASLAKINSVKASAKDTSIVLSWEKKTGITAYQVFQYNESTKKWVKAATVTTNKATISKLSPATSYTFQVRSYKKTTKGYTYSPYSDRITVKTILSKPKTPVATPGNNYVDISWTKLKNAQAYQIEFYDYTKKAWARKKTVTANSAKIESLTSVKSYKFRIRAYNKAGKLVYSPYSDVVYFTTKPDPVKSVKIDKVDTNKVTLSWSKVNKVTGYYVYVNEYTKEGKATSYKAVKSTSGTSITLTLKSCTYHRFRIMPYYKNSSGKNIYGKYATSSLALTTPTKVASFKAIDVTNTTAVLTWKTQENATGYRLYRRAPGETSTTLIATLPAETGSYKLTGLEQMSSYRYYIKAYHTLKNSKTNSSVTAGVVVNTDDDKVDSVTFTAYKTSLNVGATYTFKAQVNPSYAANKGIRYSSNKTSVATVNSKGVVTAVAPGSAYIYAKSKADSTIYARVKLTVKAVKSTGISLPSKTVLYVNESTILAPTFTPSNTTDKSITITGKDHTYSYKGLLGLITNTDTCKFSDYITVDSMGRLTPKKVTVEPNTGNAFAFTVTVKAKDSGVTATTKISVVKRTLKVSYEGSDIPWYYGNSAKLTVSVSDDAGFKKSDVIWQSSNKKVATVSSDGTVKCVGVGPATITAYSPDKTQKHSYDLYSGSVAKISKTYFESCKAGSTYKITATVNPTTSAATISYTSMNPDIVTVDENGNVKFLKSGTGSVAVKASDNYNTQKVVFTSNKWTSPDATDSSALFNLAKKHLNSIKKDMPALERTDASVFSNFVISNPSSELKAEDFEDMFSEFASGTTRYIEKVDPATAEMSKISSYYASVPVAAGQSLSVIEGIDVGSHIKSVTLNDSGSYTYDIKFVLKNEYMPNTSSATVYTAHGKVFDILSAEYINEVDSTLSESSMDVSFSNFAQNYHDSCVTVTINKATGLVEKAVYDMNINILISQLDISMSVISMFDSDLSFDVNNKVEIEVKR